MGHVGICSRLLCRSSLPAPFYRTLALLLCTLLLWLAPGCTKTPPKTMDVQWSFDPVQADDNLFARNPQWYGKAQTGQPPNVCNSCPCNNEDPVAWNTAPNCTNQTLHTNSSVLCFGHWDWFPVEYEGTVTWGGHSNSVYDDDDYYVEVQRCDGALETDARGGIHPEFDSEETVDNWDDTNTWWDDFHHNYVDDNDQAAHNRIDGKDVIVIGMLGIDSQHGYPVELNPTYSMFVHVNDDPAQDKWAFFVKNWGNEGFCGDNQEPIYPLARNTIRVRIRHPVGAGFSVTDNAYVYGDDENERNLQSWTYQTVSDGLLLTFFLRDPSRKVGFVGDLTINWGNSIKMARYGGNCSAKPLPRWSELVEDKDLKDKIDRLDPKAQKLLYAQVKGLTVHPKSARRPATLSTAAPPEVVKPAGAFPNYGSVVKPVPDPAHRARKAKQRESALAFLKSHGIH